MPSPDSSIDTTGYAPLGLVDYVVRVSAAGKLVRSFVVRAEDETSAMQLIHEATQAGPWAGWSIVDVMTVEEAIAHRGGTR